MPETCTWGWPISFSQTPIPQLNALPMPCVPKTDLDELKGHKANRQGTKQLPRNKQMSLLWPLLLLLLGQVGAAGMSRHMDS